MCVLCGEFVMNVHWTDIQEGKKKETIIAGEGQRERLRNRHHRIQLTNRILGHLGLKATDWNGSKYIINDKKGNSIIVQDLGSLWPAVEKLVGRPLDPLHPSFLQAIRLQGEC